MRPEPNETFRVFYERRNGRPYPGVGGEYMHVVMARIADTLADWADGMRPEQPITMAPIRFGGVVG